MIPEYSESFCDLFFATLDSLRVSDPFLNEALDSELQINWYQEVQAVDTVVQHLCPDAPRMQYSNDQVMLFNILKGQR